MGILRPMVYVSWRLIGERAGEVRWIAGVRGDPGGGDRVFRDPARQWRQWVLGDTT